MHFYENFKMRFFFFLFFIVSINCTLTSQAYNYTTDDVLKLSLSDGSVIIGQYKNVSTDYLIVQSGILGVVNVPKGNIKSIILLMPAQMKLDRSGFAMDDHNSTHYIVSPSAYGLRKGQKYFENIAIFWNSYAIGLTDNFSIAVGGEILSLLLNQNFPIIFFSPKLSFPFKNENGAFSFTGTIFSTPESDFRTFAFVSSALTIGSRNNNFTIGGGIGWNTEGGFKDEVVPLTLSGMYRMSRKLSLMTENWFLLENDLDDITSIVSLGLRVHFNKPGSAFNVGLWRILGVDLSNVIGIPYVSAVIALGK